MLINVNFLFVLNIYNKFNTARSSCVVRCLIIVVLIYANIQPFRTISTIWNTSK